VEDGLFTVAEFEAHFKNLSANGHLQSLWDQWVPEDPSLTFSAKVPFDSGRKGGNEPIYTSFTHYWKNTIDYIFVKLPEDRMLKVLGLLQLPPEESLGLGLPRKGVCGSDHLSLRATIAWPLRNPTSETP